MLKIVEGKYLSYDSPNRHELVWETKEEIDHEGHGIILVARKIHIHDGVLNTPVIELPFKDRIKGKTETLTTGYWESDDQGRPDRNKLPDPVLFELSITAEPSLRKPFNNLRFRLSQSDLTSLKFDYVGYKTSKIRLLKCDKEGYWS